MPTTIDSAGVMSTAARALALARDLSEMALRLRACSAELLEAWPWPQPSAAASSPAAPAQAAAVARVALAGRQPAARATLAASAPEQARSTVPVTTAALMSLDDANRELAAAARFGAWRPSPAAPARSRSA